MLEGQHAFVPCKAQISNRDVKQFLNSDVGSKIKIADEIKYNAMQNKHFADSWPKAVPIR